MSISIIECPYNDQKTQVKESKIHNIQGELYQESSPTLRPRTHDRETRRAKHVEFLVEFWDEAAEELVEKIENMFSIFSLFYGRRRPAELLGGFVPELDEELDVLGTSSFSVVCTGPNSCPVDRFSVWISAAPSEYHEHLGYFSV